MLAIFLTSLLALVNPGPAAGGPFEVGSEGGPDALGLLASAWAPAKVTDPSLVGTVADQAVAFRRALHRDVLQALDGGELTDHGCAEALRLLAILRVSDRRSIGELIQRADMTLAAEVPSAQRRGPFETQPGKAALMIVGLPAVTVLFEHFPTAPRPGGGLLGPLLLSSVAGPCALAMAEEAWGPITDPDLRRWLDVSSDMLSHKGSVHYSLRTTPARDAPETLVQQLNSNDPAIRVAPAAELIRRSKEAEQWVAEALSAGNPQSAARRFRDRTLPDAAGIPDCEYVQEWPAGTEPPTRLSDRGRYECIRILGELRPLDPTVIDVLLENISFMPETYPYPHSPAVVAAARIGLPVQWRLSLAMGRKPREDRNRLLDVMGLMLGRHATEPYRRQQRTRGTHTALEADIAYLAAEYSEARGIYEATPEEPYGDGV